MTTDPDLPLDDDELAVAAVVDGDATAEQRRRIARDPDLVARVRAAELVRDAIRAPIDSPGEDVFAALRASALDAAADGDIDDSDQVDLAKSDPVSAPPPDVTARPVDLTERRARRSRRLPPLPAVAAVVLFLLVSGAALLLTDRGGGDQRADTAADAESTGGGGASGGDDASGDTAAESAEGGGEPAAADGAAPGADFRDGLLARTTSSYGAEDELFAALRRVDPDTLDLTAAPSESQTEGDGPDTTTTVDDDEPARTTAPAPPTGASVADGRALADDPDVVRCDSVLRSAEPGVGPATAATFVSVEGIPVLVLSNPVEATDDGPATVRLTVLNAVDCSPRGAVQR